MIVRTIVVSTLVGALLLLASCGATVPSAPSAGSTAAPAAATPTPTSVPKQPAEVTFKVWGNAPAGATIEYSSDTANISPPSPALPWSATMPYSPNATMYAVTAQLMETGTLGCSVTVDNGSRSWTKTGSASGDYEICDAQLTGLFGSWG